ncbi:MAG TPA: AmmeMemoRadiSam system protein A, partial [bacterium]|nr:AmmeMemoRadiSam system protein A [bacterium]HEX67952.1 AmmeMemoRadiSam system protein A [bacterium]
IPEIVKYPRLKKPGACFVTLKENGRLRGCIGTLFPGKPLYENVARMAVSAAFYDYRFPPLRKEELEKIKIEISVLSPLKRIKSFEEIEVGKHGLYLIKGSYRGVLLPQVATEYGWDRWQFLQAVSRKAGLPPDAYKEGAVIYIFTAEVFGEEE